MPTELPAEEVFAVDLAMLAREIAMDLFDVGQILELHRLTDDEWRRIQETPKFQQMLAEMLAEWNSAASTRDRVRLKAATGLESVLEVYIRNIGDETIPLTQRTEAGKFLARLGELDGQHAGMSGGGGQLLIQLNIGDVVRKAEVTRTIEATAIPE